MLAIQLNTRIIENNDWATILFVLCFILIAVTKTFFEARFNEFLKLLVTDKYTKIYKDPSFMLSWFTISLFIVQLISFAFFILILLNHFDLASKTDWIKYIQIITLLGVFVLSKYLVEKIASKKVTWVFPKHFSIYNFFQKHSQANQLSQLKPL